MPADPEEEGLIVSGSDTPVARVGYANTILLMLFIGSVGINRILYDHGVPMSMRVLVLLGLCLATLKVYNHSVSRILVKNGKTLVLVGPFAATEISADDILETDVSVYPLNFTIVLKVKRRTSFLPTFYYFIAPVTDYGGCADTAAKLRLLLKGLRHTEP